LTNQVISLENVKGCCPVSGKQVDPYYFMTLSGAGVLAAALADLRTSSRTGEDRRCRLRPRTTSGEPSAGADVDGLA
jgi:hypothetical protein